MRKKWILSILVLALLLPAAVSATSIDTNVINEKWGKPTYAYGASLDQAQIEETMELLGIENPENINSVSVSGQDLVKYLGDGIDSTDSMISSVLVTRQDRGRGVEVDIRTPDRITQITANQYASAAITAGVTDAKILVGAVRPVTGESALTGVFKAFDVNGEELDQDRMQVAQEEIDTTNEIVQENKEDAGFSTEQFNAAIAEIKTQLQSLRERQDELATREDIERIINEALEKYQLNNIITKEQIVRLISLFERYQNTDAVVSPEVKEQLGELGNRLGDIYQQAQDSGILDQIAAFFRQLWNALKNIFS